MNVTDINTRGTRWSGALRRELQMFTLYPYMLVPLLGILILHAWSECTIVEDVPKEPNGLRREIDAHWQRPELDTRVWIV